MRSSVPPVVDVVGVVTEVRHGQAAAIKLRKPAIAGILSAVLAGELRLLRSFHTPSQLDATTKVLRSSSRVNAESVRLFAFVEPELSVSDGCHVHIPHLLIGDGGCQAWSFAQSLRIFDGSEIHSLQECRQCEFRATEIRGKMKTAEEMCCFHDRRSTTWKPKRERKTR